MGAVIGVLSTTMTWLTSDELQKIRINSGSTGRFPERTVPDLGFGGLLDSGWIFSQETMFALAAFVFFAGTMLAFYTSLGAIIQIAGYITYFKAFESAEGAVISGLPSAMGPKAALISIIFVTVGMLFPVYLWSKVKLRTIWRRFLTIAPEKNVKHEIPTILAAAGSALILWGWAVGASSAYAEKTLSYILFIVSGLVLLAIAMWAMITPWEAEEAT